MASITLYARDMQPRLNPGGVEGRATPASPERVCQGTTLMSVRTTVEAELERLGVPYEAVEIDPALADTAAFCEHYGYSLEESANTIVVAGKADPPPLAACVVLATTRLDVNNTVRKRLGARKASFASADLTREVTGMEIGGVTVFALPPTVPVWVDPAVLALDRLILGGGSRDWKVLTSPRVFEAMGAEVVDGLGKAVE